MARRGNMRQQYADLQADYQSPWAMTKAITWPALTSSTALLGYCALMINNPATIQNLHVTCNVLITVLMAVNIVGLGLRVFSVGGNNMHKCMHWTRFFRSTVFFSFAFAAQMVASNGNFTVDKSTVSFPVTSLTENILHYYVGSIITMIMLVSELVAQMSELVERREVSDKSLNP
jgi:hypothetical protein